MKRLNHLGLLCAVLLQALLISSAMAQAPTCQDQYGNDIGIDNAQVVNWKTSTPNNYHDRAHVSGTVTKLYANHTGHAHFEIRLTSTNDTLEVVYDLLFGAIPTVRIGDTIEACGDYITSYASSGHYKPSPDGALIHWIHRSDNPRHENGFLMINGTVYGQELPSH